MARRSSWFAVALVLALLFVTSHCLRGPATRDETRDTTLRSRGVSRFSTKAAEGLETTPEPFTSTTRSLRRGSKITNRANTSIYQRSKDPKIETTERSNEVSTKAVSQNVGRRKPARSDDLSRAASEDRRYLPEPSANRNANANKNNNRNEELHLEAPELTRASRQRNFAARNSRAEFQRRSDSVDLIEEATEKPRLRGGRKIQTTAPSVEVKESGRFSSQTTESSATVSERSGKVKSDVRRSTERNLRRYDSDLSNSNQVSVGIPFSTEGPTAPSASRRKSSGRSKSPANDKSETPLTSGHGSKRILTKKVDGIDGNSLDEFEDSRRKPEEIKSRKSLKSSEATSGSSRRSRGRSSELRSETSEKFKVEARSRDIASDKNKLDRRGRVLDKVKLVKSNYLASGSSRSRSRSQTKQSTLSPTESSKEFATSTTFSSTTLLEEATTLPPSTTQPPTETSTRRASKLAPKFPQKEDYFNRGLGFRGRKFVTTSPGPITITSTPPSPSPTPIARLASGWTLNRRPYVKNSTSDLSTTTSSPTTTTPSATTISNEIPLNDPIPTTTTTTTTTTSRPRGSKVFNKASIVVKIDREVNESDNYPPEFKAKLAQLKNNSVKEPGSESSPRVIKDGSSSRQTRSIEPTDLLGKHTEVNDSLEGTNSSAIPFAKLESYEANEGPKSLGGNSSFAARSRLKLANAQQQVKPESELKNSTSGVDANDNSKPRNPKRYGGPKSTTPRIVPVTVPKEDRSFTRTSKSVERGSTRVGETTRVRQYRKQGTASNEPGISGKVESATEKMKVPIKSTAERNTDPTTEKTIATTRKSRAWNAAYIDKNWQEPTSKSTTAEKVTTSSPIDSLPKTTKRPRHWNAAYIDKNWQEPASKSSDGEKISGEDSISSSPKTNKRPKNWNPGHVNKTWQESTRRADRVTEATTPNSPNKFEKKTLKYSVSSTSDRILQTTEKPTKGEDKLRRRDFRSRTATYRRHLESPISINSQEITGKDRKTSAEWLAEVNKLNEKIQIVTPVADKKELPSVAITPRYHAMVKTENSTQLSVKQEPAVSLLSNATDSKVEAEAHRGLPDSTGISSISRGTSGNSDSNIFNPTKTTYLISSNSSLLEQLRSTVAPLLSVLGAKSPEFASAYSKVDNGTLSVPRVTPSGSPPRFSAKYRGVEFFVRKPSETNSTGFVSTTPLSTDQANKPSIPVSISSPGEPKVLTYYQALETVNINNEIEQHLAGIGKVDANTIVTDRPSNDLNNAYNFSSETIVTTVEPVVTIKDDNNNNDNNNNNNDNDNLTVVMESPNLDTSTQAEITTTTTAATYTITSTSSSSAATTQTVDPSTSLPESTEINPSPFNPEFINNSSIDATSDPPSTTPILVDSTSDNYLTTEMNTEVSTTSEADAITAKGIITEETSTVSSTTEEAIKVIMASLEDKTSSPESTTSDSILSSLSTTDVSIQTTESTEATSTTEVIIDELNGFKASPGLLEVRSQIGETTTVIADAVTEVQTSMTTPGVFTSSESSQVDQTTFSVETTSMSIDSNEMSDAKVEEIDDELLASMMKRLMAPTTTIAPTTSSTSSSLTETTSTISESTTSMPANSNETSDATLEDAPRAIDDEVLALMMKRLMDIFSLDENSTLMKEMSSKMSDKSEPRIGGFLDNRDLTELDNDVEGTTANSVESSTIESSPVNSIEQNSPIVQSPELLNQIATTAESSTDSVNSEVTTVSTLQTVELETMTPQEEMNDVDLTLTPSTTYSSTDVTTNSIDNTNNNNNNNNTVTTNSYSEITTTLAYSDVADDTNVSTNSSSEVNATTLEPEVIEPTPNVDALDSVPTSPGDAQVTTNPSTATATTRALETTTETEGPNSVTTLQDEMISTVQTTPSFQQTTTQLPLSSESTTASIPETTVPSSTAQADSIPTTTDSPSSITESTTVPITTPSLPSSSSTMPTTSTSSETTTEMPSTTTSTTTTTTTMAPTTAYSGRFGGSRMTPAPRLSSSSSTRTPLRDYHVYGIYPNKTIVRKRPEDNLIDARNIDSPYVIFGIFPDGKLVRKFPNGTVIPDPPSNPVEVVFSLSTSTTTNRPTPQTQVLLENNSNNNQANNVNQPMNNNNGSATATSNNRPANTTLLTNVSGDQINDGYRSRINLGLADNSINSNGADEDPNQFADPTLMPGIGNVNTQPTTTTMVTDASSRTAGPPLGATPSSVNSQGGRIIQDIERDKASRTKEAGGQRSAVYIGQEKFINYWTNETRPSNNSRISASHQGPGTGGSLPSLDILTNNNIQGQSPAQENNRWKDPLDQIFGITTRPSAPSNTLQDESRSAITASPINPLSEVLTPVLDANQLARDTSITITDATTNTIPSTTSTTSTTTTPSTTTTTTTAAPTTSTTTTTTTTTTSTTAAPTTTSSTTPPTTTTTTTTMAPTTTFAPTTSPPTSSSPPATSSISESTLLPFTTIDVPHQTVFGSTFDDLAFLNSLLQSNENSNSFGSTPKTLTEVERQLANKILSLALSKVAGPTRSPKAIQPSNVSPNSLDAFPRPSFGHSSSSPIIIDLLEPTTKKPVARITTSEPFTWKPVTDVTSTTPTTTTTSSKPTISTTSTTTTSTTTTTTTTPASTTTTTSRSSTTVTPSTQVTWKPFPKQPPTFKSVESIPVTTPAPAKAFTGKPINRPKSTTPAPLGFGASLLQAIFGRNIFAPSTTQRPAIRRPPITTTTTTTTTTTSRPVQITELVIPAPVVHNQVQAASQHVNDVRLLNSLSGDTKVGSSTFSPEDDAKFLLELLKDSEKNAGKGVKGSSVLSQDDETFLRSILSGQAKVRTPSSVSGNSDSNNAALLAQLLKVQGIEPSTPANRLQEQLQGIKVTSMPPVQTTARVIATTKKSVTRPRPSDWQPSSTYPPPLFSNFNFGFPRGESSDDDDSFRGGGVRNQVLNAAIGATRVFSQFLGAAITVRILSWSNNLALSASRDIYGMSSSSKDSPMAGAAQQLQSFVRNSTKYVTGAVGG